jgi:hypothetical protein
MSMKSLSAVGLVAMMILAVGACSSADNDNDNPGAAGAAGHSAAGGAGGSTAIDTSSPCYAYCMARETKKDCNATSTIEGCLGYTYGCEDFATRSAGCKTALMAYWSCTAAQADPCDNPGTCGTQADALGPACN